MNRLFALFCVTATLTPFTFAHAQVSAVPSAMNFQGRLAKPDGTPVADGTHNLLVSVYSSLSGGTLLWQKSITGIAVKNGVFATRLDFSSGYQNSATQSTLFGASTVFLDISVDGGASLVPRQQFLTVAYAMKADSVKDGAITNASIADGSITSAKLASGAITSASLNPLAWLLGGNSGVTSGFLGTTDNNPLELRVNNRRAMRYVYAENTIDPNNKYRSMNVLGGSEINLIGAGVVGATIAGGGLDNFTGTDQPNHVTANFGTIGGGYSNIASGFSAIVGGGYTNTASSFYATVGGGDTNTASGGYATVGGGNTNTASGGYATVGGGYTNTASGFSATVGGGNTNTASGSSATVGGGSTSTASGISATVGGGNTNTASGGYATVGGGIFNTASGYYATVGGGNANTASGYYATVGGGNYSTASGDFSFAAGGKAKALHAGSFVWNSYDGTDFASTAPNQFLISAPGGVKLPKSTVIELGFGVVGKELNAGKIGYAVFTPDTLDIVGAAQNSGARKVKIWAEGGTTFTGTVNVNGVQLTSDVRYKKNIVALENPLDALFNLRGVSYEWRKDEFRDRGFGNGRQFGFIAQEVESVFPQLVMTDAKGFKSVNYIGVIPVAVEAIKALKHENNALKAENVRVRASLENILKRLDTLEKQNARR